MEERVGAVLLRRTRPVEVTPAGATVLRAARQVARIIDDAADELGAGDGHEPHIKLVINADSLATWFVPALARAASLTGARFEVLRADEAVSTEKLRTGEVLAALTSTAAAVPGCVSSLIGVDEYYAVAAPSFVSTHFSGGVTAAALAAAPMIEFDRHDMFQQRFLRELDCGDVAPTRHYIPSSAEFAGAIELGMGWGMLPRKQCAAAIARGALVELVPGRRLELPLYWQRWNLSSPLLDSLTAVVLDEAQRALGPRGDATGS